MKRNKETEQKKQATGIIRISRSARILPWRGAGAVPRRWREISGVSLRKWRECHSDIRMTEVKIWMSMVLKLWGNQWGLT